jgi:hypothetical protein
MSHSLTPQLRSIHFNRLTVYVVEMIYLPCNLCRRSSSSKTYSITNCVFLVTFSYSGLFWAKLTSGYMRHGQLQIECMQSGLRKEESGGAQVAYLFAIQHAEMPKTLACCITRDRHCFSIASQRQDIAVHCLLANAHRIKSHRIP